MKSGRNARKLGVRLLAGFCLMAPGLEAQANDSMDGLPIAHPVITFGGELEGASYTVDAETITVSTKTISFDMRLSNGTKKDISTMVTVPLPDINLIHALFPNTANGEEDNFLNVVAELDGKPVELSLEQRADVGNVDVTEDIENAGISLMPEIAAQDPALQSLDEKTMADWRMRGIAVPNPDEGQRGGPWFPGWRLQSSESFSLSIPAGKSVHLLVHMDAAPETGFPVGFMEDGKPNKDLISYQGRFCFDDGFVKQVAKLIADPTSSGSLQQEQTISLPDFNPSVTRGPIRIVVDKGEPDALVAFCGADVKQTGPTTSEFTIKNATFGEPQSFYFLQADHPDP